MPHSTMAIDSGKAMAVGGMALEQPRRLPGAVLQPRTALGMRKGSKPCRLRPVGSIAGRAQQVAARRRADEAAVQRAAGAPAISCSSASSRSVRGELAEAGRSPHRPPWPPPALSASSGERPSTRASIAARSGRTAPARPRPSPAACRRALPARVAPPTTCSPCGISVYSSSRMAAPSFSTCVAAFVAPGRLGGGEVERGGLGLDQQRQIAALVARLPRRARASARAMP